MNRITGRFWRDWDAYEWLDCDNPNGSFYYEDGLEGEEELIFLGHTTQPISKHLPATRETALAKYFAELKFHLETQTGAL